MILSGGPTKAKFERLCRQGHTHIPIFREILADVETAVGLYLKLGNQPYSYLLESVQGGERWGRYSIVGLSANTFVRVHDKCIELVEDGEVTRKEVAEPISWIQDYLAQFKIPKINGLPVFNGGLVGYFGYETIAHIEPCLDFSKQKDTLNVPDILLMVSNELVVFDNFSNKAFVIVHAEPIETGYADGVKRVEEITKEISKKVPVIETTLGESEHREASSSFKQEEFEAAVREIKDHILSGDVMQVVLSRRISYSFGAHPFNFYRQLRHINPSPYLYYLDFGEFHVVGSSPEILARVDEAGGVTLRPLAGTRARGANDTEDKRLEAELLADEKELAEHLMLIDLGRNDVGRVSELGTVALTRKMYVEHYSHVIHIVSNIESKLAENLSVIDVLRATFPAGTVSGAPKIRAMEVIASLEPLKRNIYAGAVGYLSWHGAMDMAIAIRTAVVKDKQLHLQVGAGVVYDSDPRREWDETTHKAQALVKSIESV